MSGVPDTELVAALHEDRGRGFDALYLAYSERLYAYALAVLRDREAAEDATHDALLSAVANIDRLREPNRLRPWLFAITRNRCLSALRDRGRFTHDEELLTGMASEEDAARGAVSDDTTELVQAALLALAPADKDVLTLALRSDLDTSMVAQTMGSNQPTARARISRAKVALNESVTGLLLARQPQKSCAGLTATLRGYDGEWTPLARKRVAKHVRACSECSEDGNRRAVSYVSAITLPVVLALPAGARARADELLATSDLTSLADSGQWRGDGFPAAGEAARTLRRHALPLAAGAAAVVVLALTAVVANGNAEPTGTSTNVVPTAPASSAPAAGAPGGGAGSSGEPDWTTAAARSPRPSDSQEPPEPSATPDQNDAATQARRHRSNTARPNGSGAESREPKAPHRPETSEPGTTDTPEPQTQEPQPPDPKTPDPKTPDPAPPTAEPPPTKEPGRPTVRPTAVHPTVLPPRDASDGDGAPVVK